MCSKTFSVLGDSISTLKGWVPDEWRIHYEGEVHIDGVTQPANTWWGQVAAHFDGSILRNFSFSGSVVEGFGFPAGCSPQRLDYLLGEDGQQPDVVLINMGINDYGWGGGRNQVMGRSVSASAQPEDLEGPREVVGIVGPEALDLFRTAYTQVLQGIRQRAPQAEIWCLTLAPGTVPGAPWPNFVYSIRGIELDDYNKAIAEAAQEQNAHVADIRAFGIDYSSVDGVHPDALGMSQIAAMVCLQMEGKPADPALHPLLADAPKSQRQCYEPNCHGCPYVEIEDNRWSLYCSKFEASA